MKLLKWLIVIVIAVICIKAYTASKQNGKSFINNVGKETKVLSKQAEEKGKVVIDKTIEGVDELKEGYENTN